MKSGTTFFGTPLLVEWVMLDNQILEK